MNKYALLTLVAGAVALWMWFRDEPSKQPVGSQASASPQGGVASVTPKPASATKAVPGATAARVIPTPAPVVGTRIRAGVNAAKMTGHMTLRFNSAFILSQLDAAKAKAIAERKPLGFLMVWDHIFGVETDTRSAGSVPALAHFYRAFNSNLVLVYVRHEAELDLVPDSVKQGFRGPDEGGWAPNMAVVDATASEFIVEIPMGGKGDGKTRDDIFAGCAEKIDRWLATHPMAVATPTPKP